MEWIVEINGTMVYGMDSVYGDIPLAIIGIIGLETTFLYYFYGFFQILPEISSKHLQVPYNNFFKLL